MQVMNNNSVLTGYIKQMLRDFNLPKADYLLPGRYVFKGMRYVDRHNIYRCAKTSWFDGASYENLETVAPYVYGKEYLNVTRRLNSTVGTYDYKTHEFLGDYLRFYRDYKGINLMSMYNCFGGRTGKFVDLSFTSENGSSINFDSSDATCLIYVVPVRLQNEYTIAIDCSTAIELVVGVYDGSRLTVDDESLYKNTYFKHSWNMFARPFVYRGLKNLSASVSESIANQERNLVLFVKVPASNSSSFSVLEGDWLSSTDSVFVESGRQLHRVANNYEPKRYFDFASSGKPAKSQIGDIFIDRQTGLQYRYDDSEASYVPLSDAASMTSASDYSRDYVSRLQLLTVNDGASHPFADKLIGYLLGNVITGDDGISDNIRRLQRSLINRKDVGYAYSRNFGSWEPELRDYVYDLSVRLGIADGSFDSIGFVDKDIERVFGSDIGYDVGGHGISGGTR